MQDYVEELIEAVMLENEFDDDLDEDRFIDDYAEV